VLYWAITQRVVVIYYGRFGTDFLETSVRHHQCTLRNSPEEHSSQPPSTTEARFNLLKPTCYVMHHQFNIQQLYVLPTLYLCVLYLSENKQRLVPLTP